MIGTSDEETLCRTAALADAAAELTTEIDASGVTRWTRRDADSRLPDVSVGESTAESAERLHPDDRKDVEDAFIAVLRGGPGDTREFRVRDRAGHWCWVESRWVAYRAPDGERRILTLTRDIARSRARVDALVESEERFRLMATHGHDMISEHDPDGNLLWANEQAFAAAGRSRESVAGEHPLDSVHPEDLDRVAKAADRVLATGEPASFVHRQRHSSGAWLWFESNAHRQAKSDGSLRLVTQSRDITVRMQAQQALKESEERYRELLEQLPEAVGVVFEGPGGVIAYANPAAAALVGVEDCARLIGRSALEFISPESVRAARVRRTGDHSELEMEISRSDGETRQLVASWQSMLFQGRAAVQCLARDVTDVRHAQRERERLRSQLEESRKLESLGVLAGGIAHDFNNLLTVVLANARFAHRESAANPEVRAALEEGVDAAETAARLTAQLLAYAGRREPEVRAIDLSAHTGSVSQLLRTAIPKTIALELDLDASLPDLSADVVQIEQVVMNLVLNAVDAIGDAPGSVRVATRAIRADRDEIATWIASDGLSPGPYVCLEVADSGCGMDEEIRGRIFDPFFTTKLHGHGLGLSAVLGLVRGHRGGVSIQSRRDEGTTFRVFLPARASD